MGTFVINSRKKNLSHPLSSFLTQILHKLFHKFFMNYSSFLPFFLCRFPTYSYFCGVLPLIDAHWRPICVES